MEEQLNFFSLCARGEEVEEEEEEEEEAERKKQTEKKIVREIHEKARGRWVSLVMLSQGNDDVGRGLHY